LVTGRYVKNGKGKNATVTFEVTAALTLGDGVVFRAEVTDGGTTAIPNAAVVFAISGPEAATLTSGPSDSNGIAEATWQTKAPNKRGMGGTNPGLYTVTVTGSTAAGYQWDGVQTSTNFQLSGK
jgi:hypothetical protein